MQLEPGTRGSNRDFVKIMSSGEDNQKPRNQKRNLNRENPEKIRKFYLSVGLGRSEKQRRNVKQRTFYLGERDVNKS